MTFATLFALIALILAIVALFVSRKIELLSGAIIFLAIAVLLGSGLATA